MAMSRSHYVAVFDDTPVASPGRRRRSEIAVCRDTNVAERQARLQNVRGLATHFGVSAIGPGFLTLPYGISIAGLQLGVAYIIMSALISTRSVMILARAKQSINHLPLATYPALVRTMLGPKLATFLEAVIILNGLGVAVSILILLADFAPPAIKSLLVAVGYPEWMDEVTRNRILLVAAVVCVAMACIKDLSRLSWLSSVPIVAVIWTALTMLYLLVRILTWHGLKTGITMLMETRPSLTKAGLAMNVFLFAFMMHTNVIPLLKSLPKRCPRQGRFVFGAVLRSHGTLAAFYFAFSIVATLTDLGTIGIVTQNAVLALPETPAVAVLRVVLCLGLLATGPYQFVAVASSMIECYRRFKLDWQVRQLIQSETTHLSKILPSTSTAVCSKGSVGESTVHSADSDDTGSDSFPEAYETRDGLPPPEMATEITSEIIAAPASFRTRVAAACILIGVAFTIAFLTSQVATILSMFGGLGSTTLMCTMPALLQWAMVRRTRVSRAHIRNRFVGWIHIVDQRVTIAALLAIALAGYAATGAAFVALFLHRSV